MLKANPRNELSIPRLDREAQGQRQNRRQYLPFEAIRNVLMSVLSISTEVEWTVRNIAETAEGHVMTERIDAFVMNGKWVRLPVMGIFELENGIITSWRDYFDANQMVQMMTAE